MIKTIEPKEVLTPSGTTAGTATQVFMEIQFFAGQQTARGYYKYMDADGAYLADGNEELNANGWGEDDSVMFDRLATKLSITFN